MASGKNLLKTSLTEPKIQCSVNSPLNNNLLLVFLHAMLVFCSQSRCIQGALIETAPEAEKQGGGGGGLFSYLALSFVSLQIGSRKKNIFKLCLNN